ncbi:MAG: hypothetical protein FWF23_05620 [Alphaproteobacteria bacterium]|nr:hypothetical protein [Alphaproteobacteria bacterium]MCL2505069.1 hypothetical protein [Alphaproteobacteria bacterium]
MTEYKNIHSTAAAKAIVSLFDMPYSLGDRKAYEVFNEVEETLDIKELSATMAHIYSVLQDRFDNAPDVESKATVAVFAGKLVNLYEKTAARLTAENPAIKSEIGNHLGCLISGTKKIHECANEVLEARSAAELQRVKASLGHHEPGMAHTM